MNMRRIVLVGMVFLMIPNGITYSMDYVRRLMPGRSAPQEQPKPTPEKQAPSEKKPTSLKEKIADAYKGVFGDQVFKLPQSPIKPDVYERATGMTTSEVYAEIFRQKILDWYGDEIAQNKINILELLAREREYFDDYYVFYHGQNAIHRILQDFWYEIFSFVHGKYPENFIPLRFWKDSQTPTDSNPQQFMLERDILPDFRADLYSKDVQPYLLPVNIALFGSIGDLSSSTLHFYLNTVSLRSPPTNNLLSIVFEHYSFTSTYIKSLVEKSTILGENFGNLLQVFIPKKLVDRCVYLSKGSGVPYRQDLGVGGYDHEFGYQATISPLLEIIESGKVPTEKITKDVLNFLHAYIVIGTDIMLNPESGVKVFREVNLPEKKVEEYQDGIRKIALAVIIDWLDRLIQGKIPQEVIARLQGTPLAEVIKDRKKAAALLEKLKQAQKPAQPVIPSKL